MAYNLTYWQAEPCGQSSIKAIRLKSIEEVQSLALEHNHPKNTVMITVDRTDKQSPISKIVWQKKNYIDPCNNSVGDGELNLKDFSFGTKRGKKNGNKKQTSYA